MALSGKEASHISNGCRVASCGANNPIAGLIARSVIDEINNDRVALQSRQTNEVAQQNVGTQQTGREGGRS